MPARLMRIHTLFLHRVNKVLAFSATLPEYHTLALSSLTKCAELKAKIRLRAKIYLVIQTNQSGQSG